MGWKRAWLSGEASLENGAPLAQWAPPLPGVPGRTLLHFGLRQARGHEGERREEGEGRYGSDAALSSDRRPWSSAAPMGQRVGLIQRPRSRMQVVGSHAPGSTAGLMWIDVTGEPSARGALVPGLTAGALGRYWEPVDLWRRFRGWLAPDLGSGAERRHAEVVRSRRLRAPPCAVPRDTSARPSVWVVTRRECCAQAPPAGSPVHAEGAASVRLSGGAA